MTISYIRRDTASGLANTGGDVETTEFVKLMDNTTTESVEVTITITSSATERCKWITSTDIPHILDWQGGTYTWRLRVITPNTLLRVTEVILRRLSFDGVTVRASKSSDLLLELLTESRRGTILWNDGTQNPVDRAMDDRLEVVFRITNTGLTDATAGIGTNTANGDDIISTPLRVRVKRLHIFGELYS